MVVYYLTSGLRKDGHKVYVVTTETEKEKNNEFDNHQDTLRFPINFKIYNTPISVRAFSAINSIAEDVDIIHSHGYPVYFSDISTYVGLRKKVPLVLHWVVDPRQAVISEQSNVARVMNDAYFRVFGNKVFEASTVIIVPSQNYEDYLVEKGVDAHKISVLPCGVDTSVFNPDAPIIDVDDYENTILFVGRVSDQKGFDVLLRAFPDVLMRHPKTQLVVIGLPDQKYFWGEIEKDVERVRENIKFLGNISRELIARWYATADVLAFPSRFESFGIVAIEAMSCATPVVGTDVGAIGGLIEKGGLLIKKEDRVGLANALNTLLSNKDLAKKLGRNAAELVSKEYSWGSIVKKLERIYRDILD